MPRARILATLSVSCIFAACGDTPPHAQSPSAAAAPSALASARVVEPPDGPVAKLRTGAIAPVDAKDGPDAKLVSRFVADGVETLVAELTIEPTLSDAWRDAVVALDARDGEPAYFSFASRYAGYEGRGADGGSTAPTVKLWLRRSASAAGSPALGQLFVPGARSRYAAEPGRHLRLRLADTTSKPSDSKALEEWLHEFGVRSSEGGSRASAWQGFAADRVERLSTALAAKRTKIGPKVGKRAASALVGSARPRAADGELARLMETTTGATAVQEALQNDRALFMGAAREKPSVPLASLKAPPLGHHPWREMLAKLGAPPTEGLAGDAPADFYFVRAKDLPSLFRLLDAVDDWGTPAASIAEHTFEDRALAVRHETQLGLRRSALARALGGAVVGEVAFVGSDPYVKEGSDVTMLLRVKSRTLFDAALAGTLGEHERDHGPLVKSTRSHGGVTVSTALSADGAVLQQRATVGDVELISNSAHAIDVVLDTAAGKHPKLQDELDFQFMLARDAETRADVLAFMSDRFVGEVVGPRQKVQQARREVAMAELMTPGFAALLHGWLYGASPVKVEELFLHGLLTKDELTHASGAPIRWTPGGAARSAWGTVASLTPMLDLPAPELVTPAEQAGYERFARTYQDNWSGYIDPVAVRVAMEGPSGAASRMTFDVRELPLIDGTEYRELERMVGAARFASAPLASGARGIVGVAHDAPLRGFLTGSARGFSRHEFKFDWVGDWAMVGTADRSEVAATLLKLGGHELPQLPAPRAESEERDDWMADVARLPLYAEVGITSPAAVGIAIAGLRVIAEETIPGMFQWGEVGRHRDVSIVRIAMQGKAVDAKQDLTLFYAVCNGALVVTLQEWVMNRLIDDRLDGRGPDAARGKPTDGSQLVFELASEKDKGLWSAVAWMAERELLDAHHGGSGGSVAAAEALLRGAPEMKDAAASRALSFAYWGALPLAPDGGVYGLAKEGVVDPARGSEYAPRWPSVPVAGSPLEKVMRAVTRVRTELSFDDEGQADGKAMKSLHARATVDTAPGL